MKAASAQRQKTRRSEARTRARDHLRDEVAGVFRRTILDAAERVFGARGFAAAKMAEIAAGAGLGTGTLYNYFDSKEEIFRALVDERGDEFIGALESIIAGDGGAQHQLVGLTRATFAFIEAHSAMFLLLSRPEMADANVRRACGDENDACRRYLQAFQRCLAAARREGVVSDGLPTVELTQVLTGMMEGLVRGWFLGGRRPGALIARADFVVRLFLRGAGAR